jgi:hypothetical protein
MDTRFSVFIFGIIAVAAIFFAGISSSPVAFGVHACWVVTSTVNYCTTSSDQKWYICVKNKPPCKEMKFSGPPDSPPDTLPPELQHSLDASIADAKANNDTKVPKSDLLNDGGLLKGQSDNQSTSKTIVGPNDRFCKEGTGGETGNKCIPCDPGLKFVVGCIDVTTGGPLDIPDAATSEEEDDTNPKDLDGSNNDDNGPAVNPGSD